MRTFLLLLFGVLLLGGAWYLTSGSDSSRAPSPSVTTPEVGNGPVSAGADLDDVGQPDAPTRAAAQTRPEAATSPAPEQLQLLNGRLVDALGRPSVGAQLWLEDSGSGRRARFGGEPRARATTDGTGAFAFEHEALEAGRHLTISARVQGFAPLDHALVASGALGASVGDLVLDRGVVLAGQVLDDEGTPVPEAELLRDAQLGMTVLGLGETIGEELATTDGEGRFEIVCQAVGPWALRVRHPRHREELFHGETSVPDEQQLDLSFVLQRGAAIEGELVGAPSADFEGVNIELWPLEDGASATTMRVLDPGSGARVRRVPVQPDGSFAVGGLVEGQDYRLQAQRRVGFPYGSVPVSESLRVSAGDRSVLVEWSEGALVEFQVLDRSTGEPIENVGVRFGFGMRMPHRSGGFFERQRYPDGRVRIDGLYPEKQGSSLGLSLAAPGYEPYATELRLAAGAELALGPISLAPVPRVVITVLDGVSGAPIEDARVTLLSDREGPFRGEGMPGEVTAHRAWTDGEGRVLLSSLPGQTVELEAVAEGFAPLKLGPIELPELGDAQHELRLVAGASALVTVLDTAGEPAPGQVIEHERPDAGDMESFGGPEEPERTDAQGRQLFDHLEPGRHWFRVREQGAAMGTFRVRFTSSNDQPSGDGWVALDVAPGDRAELSLHLSQRGALEGKVTEGGLPLAGARLSLVRQNADGMPSMMGSGPSAESSSRGVYRFEDVREGEYRLEVRHASRALLSSFPLSIETGEQDFDLDLPINTVSGKVVDLEGKPMVGIAVKAGRPRGEGPVRTMVMVTRSGSGPGVLQVSDGREVPEEVRTDEEGRYTLRGMPSDTKLVVEAKAQGFQPATSEAFELRPGEDQQGVELVLLEGGRLRVVVDIPDYPASLMVFAMYQGDGADPGPQAKVLEGGEVLFEDLPAGPWSVRVQAMGPPPEGAPDLPEAQVIEVTGGEQALADFRL